SVDLVILNEKPPSYEQELQGSLDDLVRASQQRISSDPNDVHGNIILLRGDLISPQERTLLQTAARAVLLSRHGTLAEQVIRSQRAETAPKLVARPPRRGKDAEVSLKMPDLEFFNGLGGFAEEGREYVTVVGEGLRTPAPWINVIANPSFGFLVSESGSGYTWSGNSRENQLTPWSNDPVTDPAGEAIYIRDEDTGSVWSPTALPVRDEATTFAEWVLGNSRSTTAPHIITELDAETEALFAHSAWGGEFGGRVAFSDLGGRQRSWSGDRTEFLGRNGVMERPAALQRGGPLSGRVGAGLDPCAAMQTLVELR